MRSLIVQFADCEGPGILEGLLRDKSYSITYHDSYKKGLELIPQSHQVFDLIVLMGGHHSVANLNEQKFFEPFYKLVEYSLALPKTKIIGICLGAQIIAKVLGSQVVKGDKGAEVGFGKAKIISSPHPVFKGINTSEIDVFHLHEDTFAIPKDATHLLSSDIYASQMFSYKDRAFGIQCHIEPTYSMLEVWHKRFSSISPVVKLGDDARKLISSVNSTGKIILENIINL